MRKYRSEFYELWENKGTEFSCVVRIEQADFYELWKHKEEDVNLEDVKKKTAIISENTELLINEPWQYKEMQFWWGIRK
jgi:hypothetical protein